MAMLLRKLILGVSFAAVAVPGIAIALASAEAVSSTLASPSSANDFAFAYAAWWAGLAAAFLLPTQVSTRSLGSLRGIATALCFVAGLLACAWLEWSSVIDAKRIAPIGLFVTPYVGAVIFAALCEMGANPSIEGTASGLRPPAAPHVKR